MPLERSEKAACCDEAQSEDLPANRVSYLRPKERYVPVARSAAGFPADARRLRYRRGIYRLRPVDPAFSWHYSGRTQRFPLSSADAGWYPAAARMWFPAAGGACQPRWPQAIAPVPPVDAGPASASPGTGVDRHGCRRFASVERRFFRVDDSVKMMYNKTFPTGAAFREEGRSFQEDRIN